MAQFNVVRNEYFYGAFLDKNGASVTWDAREDNAGDRLHLKQILLGHKANADEINVVEMTAVTPRGSITTPIAVLKAGDARLIQPNIRFDDGAIQITLIEGNGPVYLVGNLMTANIIEDSTDEDDFNDDDDEDL